jgi:hypothetical protein
VQQNKKNDWIAKAHKTFGGYQKEALRNTLSKMCGMGWLDDNYERKRGCKLDEIELGKMFEAYYAHFLRLEIKTPMPKIIGELDIDLS